MEANAKATLLTRILDDPALSRVLVFARTKHRANRVAEKLGKGGISAEAIHGNKSQGARQRALQRFRDGDARVLVATDIAAGALTWRASAMLSTMSFLTSPRIMCIA